jgi:FdhD protein
MRALETVMLFDASVPSWKSTFPCIGSDADGAPVRQTRALAEELPVALVYGGSTEAVMMATPADLDDFAFGFSMTEGIIARDADVSELTIVATPHGIELRMWLAGGSDASYRQRRRRLAGPTGCGLCGLESLAEAARDLAPVPEGRPLLAAKIREVITSLETAQELNGATRATHAAGLWTLDAGLVAIREDVGRHNALDKLAGALLRQQKSAAEAVIAITSRISVEMVQKAARIGAPILIAISAPTALAVRAAEAANITLVAMARGRGYQLFTHPRRIVNA